MGRRIIPARAGFTDTAAKKADANADHPRSRGVYVAGRPGYEHVRGSSPLARGLLIHRVLRAFGWGIIPARAGFTRTRRTAPTTSGDHPRSRGVYVPSLRRRYQESRIIPARAGFTENGAYPTVRLGDHPRSRGVYPIAAGMEASFFGSSPLARGLQGLHPLDEGVGGIIPARAGFTNPR